MTKRTVFSRCVGCCFIRGSTGANHQLFLVLTFAWHHSLPPFPFSKTKTVCFQEETGIPARCSSREVPRTYSPMLPSILKTDKEGASKENIERLAAVGEGDGAGMPVSATFSSPCFGRHR